MPLTLGRLPAVASHTFAAILGFSLAGASRPHTEPFSGDMYRLPGKGRIFINIPDSLSNGRSQKNAPGTDTLSVVRSGDQGPKKTCILAQAILKQIQSRPLWIAEGNTSDLPVLASLFEPYHPRSLRVVPADEARGLPPCPRQPEVFYGSP